MEYIAEIFDIDYLSQTNKEPELVSESEDTIEARELEEGTVEVTEEAVPEMEPSLEKAIASYRKLREGKNELTDAEQSALEKECKEIEDREIIEVDTHHEPKEVPLIGKGKISIGPPTLTRFEKARIMGARALQLSLGAPPFLEITKNMHTSLDIAMEELEQKVIPITIRRVLPNGDYQNIPIDYFI